MAAQLNVPGSDTTGIEAGADKTAPPSSQHGAGPQAGPQGSQTGAPQGSACRRHGERNSMNDWRRSPPPPKQLPQLLHPGAAARLPMMSARHIPRVMSVSSLAGGVACRPVDESVVADDATETLAHDSGTRRQERLRRAVLPRDRGAMRAGRADGADSRGPARGCRATRLCGSGHGSCGWGKM